MEIVRCLIICNCYTLYFFKFYDLFYLLTSREQKLVVARQRE